MPHLILQGQLSGDELLVPSKVYRWRQAVLKTGDSWLRHDRAALLVEGVVVEFSRPLLPVAIAVAHHENTIVRLWSPAAVERTLAVQRWLAHIACELQARGGLEVISSNLPDEVLSDLDLIHLDSECS